MNSASAALIRLLLLLSLAGSLAAQEVVIRHVFDTRTDTHVEVLTLFSEPPATGFLPVRVTIANNLTTDRQARLHFQSRTSHRSSLSASAVFEFNAPAGEALSRDVLVPVTPHPRGHHDTHFVTVRLTGTLGIADNTIRTGIRSAPAVLLSEALHTPNASALDAEVSGRGGSRYGTTRFASRFDPKQLPSEWLAFSGFDYVIMTDGDWIATPPGSRGAIHSWLVLGGSLVIFSETDATPASLGMPATTGYGKVTIERKSGLPNLDATETVKMVDAIQPNRPRFDALNTDYDGSWPLQAAFGRIDFRYGLFIFVLIVFAVLVGPLNLFVFAKSGRRHRLFLTTPLISLATSLVLVVLIIFQDGFGGAGIRRVLMEVVAEGGSNAAHLHQEQISRSGILLGSAFTVDPACFITPVPIARNRWARYTNHYETTGRFDLQPAGGKLAASGDWWQSRSEHGHAISAVVPTRGRIERGPDPGEFVSTFDFPLRVFYYLDDDGEWHRAENIATGKPFTPAPADAGQVGQEIAGETTPFARRNQQILLHASRRKSHFVAVTDKAPAIDTLTGIHWRKTETVITGAPADR